jgi:pyruvate dehydrogenase E1 component
VAADVWSVTSYKNLYWDAIAAARWNRLNPEKKPRPAFIERQLDGEKGVFIAASDYLRALPASVAQWFPGPLTVLGTDGYGRSDTRADLRDFFEVDARHIAFAALSALARQDGIDTAVARKARKDLEIDPLRDDPLFR